MLYREKALYRLNPLWRAIKMETATIRIPEKKNLLKAISSLENRKMNEIIVDLIQVRRQMFGEGPIF